jgi:hypothetical protein
MSAREGGGVCELRNEDGLVSGHHFRGVVPEWTNENIEISLLPCESGTSLMRSTRKP